MLTYLANPVRFLKFAKYAIPLFAILSGLLLAVGLWFSLIGSPEDYQQGDSVRIMYVHVPAAWCALMAYTALTIASFVSYVWRHPLADIAAKSFAVPGLAFTFLCLVTGSLWARPTWGTWWEWDGRMTSVLILFFIYIAYLNIGALVEDKKKSARYASILAMVGFINIPIIKFSVEWWNSLHQPATISNIGAPGLPPELLTPLLLMALGFSFFFGWASLTFMKRTVLKGQAVRRKPQSGASIEIETL